MNLTKILIAIVVVAALVILARIFLKPSELKWDEMPSADCELMQIKASVKGGSGIYEFSIDNGKNFFPSENGNFIKAVESEGDYYIVVNDGESTLTNVLTVPCQFKKVEVDPCLENKVSASARGYRESSADAADGKIKVSINDGCPPYTIYLNGKVKKKGLDGSSYTIKGLPPGSYKIRVESKFKENYLDIPNNVYVAKYKPPTPKVSEKKLENALGKYIEDGYKFEIREKILEWFADDNKSVNSVMIDLPSNQSEMSIDLYLSRLKFQADIIQSVSIGQITFDSNNDIITYTVNETPK